ncbi:MAG: HmuY family protein [Prevotellaceae bacterium]|nr:HmuY family protein [Prevotellaceae bacterium]
MKADRAALPLFLIICLALTACYDDPADMPDLSQEENTLSYVDARSYTEWVYIDLSEGTTLALDYKDTVGVPERWTFALHRYDCKTNGGSALETPFTSLDDLLLALSEQTYKPATSEFTPDTEGDIIIDVSHMIEGYLIYDIASRNEALSLWLNVDISTMPPIYTQSGKVYLLREADGTLSALRFTGFSNPYYYDTKGYISFQYRYDIEL